MTVHEMACLPRPRPLPTIALSSILANSSRQLVHTDAPTANLTTLAEASTLRAIRRITRIHHRYPTTRVPGGADADSLSPSTSHCHVNRENLAVVIEIERTETEKNHLNTTHNVDYSPHPSG
jgi:hypothetical protein